jgi:hypothetical protein
MAAAAMRSLRGLGRRLPRTATSASTENPSIRSTVPGGGPSFHVCYGALTGRSNTTLVPRGLGASRSGVRARRYGTRPATGCLPAETLSLVSHEPPVICRFSQHPLGVGVYGFVGQSVAFCGLGAKFFSSSHSSSIPPGKRRDDGLATYHKN